MRDLLTLSRYAIRLPGMPPNARLGGCFDVTVAATGTKLRVIASAVLGWDHVSVSLKNRCPNWPEMSRIKELFFYDHECAMQLHVPAADHISNHPYCLHLFRPHHDAIPRPPAELVGFAGLNEEQVRAMSLSERVAMREQAYAKLVGAST